MTVTVVAADTERCSVMLEEVLLVDGHIQYCFFLTLTKNILLRLS